MMFFLALSAFHVHGQEKITGVVKDDIGFRLPGVIVSQKGSKRGVATDLDGRFTIILNASKPKTLTFDYLGFQNQEIEVGSNSVINVTLKESTEFLDEVVVIGYAPVERKKITFSVSTVKAETIEQATPVSALEGIQGRVAGVQIISNGGPGSNFDVRVRGVSTFGSGNSPLYVVDGQQLDDIDNLNPNDIASLEVLKDGATAAIYGSKAANGVVLITTKSAKKGELKVDVNSITGISTLVGDLRVANTTQRILYERLNRTNTSTLTTLELDSLSLIRRNSWDLQDLVTRTAIRQQTNVSLTSGGDKSNFYWNTGFTDENGVAQ